jgi:GT2 family glycosyltransferase
MTASAAIVVIGRNEGERLKRCLASLRRAGELVVYVDSGSTDGSVEIARAMGVDVVALVDMRAPFTAARARNEGFARVRELAPDIAYVQFVDGDCEVAPGWLELATGFLGARADVAVVCGRLRERHPERSIYNLLSDIEWDLPAGEAPACGGIALMRARAFESMAGFRADMVAGEEPELCVRLRAAGWRIWRLEAEMALHDAAMTRFGQWWRRTRRAGYAFAQGAALHGAPPERHWVRESRSALFWAVVLPAAVVAAAAAWGAWGLVLLAAYPLQVVRLALRGKRTARENWWSALFLVLGKFPEMLGQAAYAAHRCKPGGRSR